MAKPIINTIQEDEFDKLLGELCQTNRCAVKIEKKPNKKPAQARPASSIINHAPIYAKHFGLKETPFSLTPDTRFFFSHGSHQDALNTLLIALRSGEGFTKITSEVGTGKTLLCRLILQNMDKDFLSAYIPNPYLDPPSLFMAIADELGIHCPQAKNQQQLLKALGRFIIETNIRSGRAIVVCIDDAHAMPVETLEALRLLSNLETQQRKLIQLVLFGQPELNKSLQQPSIRQLQQRISFSCQLRPLSDTEIKAYLQYRLHIAGCIHTDIFTRSAIRQMFKATEGTHRLVNIIAHKAMLSAFGSGHQRIKRTHIKTAINDTESLQEHHTTTKHLSRFLSRSSQSYDS